MEALSDVNERMETQEEIKKDVMKKKKGNGAIRVTGPEMQSIRMSFYWSE